MLLYDVKSSQTCSSIVSISSCVKCKILKIVTNTALPALKYYWNLLQDVSEKSIGVWFNIAEKLEQLSNLNGLYGIQEILIYYNKIFMQY